MIINSKLYTLKLFPLINADLVENFVAAIVVAKTPIHTALEAANFYWYVILLSPAVEDIMTPRATSVIIIAIYRTLTTLFVNDLYWNVGQNKKEIKESFVYSADCSGCRFDSCL